MSHIGISKIEWYSLYTIIIKKEKTGGIRMRTKKLTAVLTALALTAGSISFPVNLYAEPEHIWQENMEQEAETKLNSEWNSNGEENVKGESDNQETTKTDAEPESIVQILKDNKYSFGCVLARDEKRIALRNPDGKLVIFDGQKTEEKIISDKEGNELEVQPVFTDFGELTSYFIVLDKNNQMQLSDIDGNLFRNGDKFYQRILILDNKYVIYSEDGENFLVSTFDSDKDIGEFRRSEYGGNQNSKYGFTNEIEKIEAGHATYYAVAETADTYGTYTIFDENFHLLIKHIDEWSVYESEYFDDIFLACRQSMEQSLQEFLFNSQYECVETDISFTAIGFNNHCYSFFENDKNYICKKTYGNDNNYNYEILDRQYKRVFNGIVDLKYYDDNNIIDGSGTGASARKVITVISEDGTINYYVYKDGEFHPIGQGMKLVDVKAKYSLYEAEGKQELYYWNEKVWSGSDKYQEIQLQNPVTVTFVALVHKEPRSLYDIYIPENRKIELSDVDDGFRIQNHRFLGKSNGKILFYDLEKEEIIYSIDEASMADFVSGHYNSGGINIKIGEVHDIKYDGKHREAYPLPGLYSEIDSCYAYPGIYISENLQDYQIYQELGSDVFTTYKPCINSSGYICILKYYRNYVTDVITKQAVYNLEMGSEVLTYTDKYVMYYYNDNSSGNTEMKVFFLNLETGDKIALNDLLNEKYSSLAYGSKTITYDLNNVSIVQTMIRANISNFMDIIDGKNIYLNISGTSNGQDTVPITLVLDGTNLERFDIYPGYIIYNANECFFTYDENKMYQVDKESKKVTGELELIVDNIECEDFYVDFSLAVYPCQGKNVAIVLDSFAEIKISELEKVGFTYYDDRLLYGYNKESKRLEIYDLSMGKLIKEVPVEDYIEKDYNFQCSFKSYFTEDSDIGRISYINIKLYDKDMQYYPLTEVYYDKDGNELDINEIEGLYSGGTQGYSHYYIKSKDKCVVTDSNGNICITLGNVPENQGVINGDDSFHYIASLEDGTKCLLNSKYQISVENQDFIENYLASENRTSYIKFEIGEKIYCLLKNDINGETYSLYDETYNLITNEITRLFWHFGDDNSIYYTDKGIYYIGTEGPVFYESAQSFCKLNDNYIVVTYKDNTDIIDRKTLQTIYQIQGCYKFQLYTESTSHSGPFLEYKNQYYAELIENYYLAYTEEENETVYYLVYFGADKQILNKDGLLVIADKKAQLPEDTILSVQEITDSFIDEDILNKFKEDYILNLIYDISLYQGENEVQIKDSVTVMIHVPDTEKQGYRVLRIEEDGSLTDMKAVQKDNYLTFIAEHFSKYAVVQNKFTLGDVNGDGRINIKDSALVRRHVAKWKVDINLDAADVNKDGKINIKDSVLIRRYVAKWIEEF